MIDGLITGVVNLALFGLVVMVRRRVHHEGLAAFGLQGDVRSWRLLLAGVAAGTLLFATYVVAAVAFGAGRLAVAWPAFADSLVLLASWGFGFAGVALFEEGLFRGYLLSKLCARFSSAVGITAQAVLFGAFHLLAYAPARYRWLGMVNVTVLAVVYAVLVLRTRSLMSVVGLHLSWDLVQTVLLSHQVGGVHAALNLQIREGVWTGTAHTPEAGLIASFIIAGFGVVVASMSVFKRSPSIQAVRTRSSIGTTRFLAAVLLVGGVVAAEAQSGPTLNALTVPGEALPSGCALEQPAPRPVPSARAEGTVILSAEASPFPTNPWSGTDRKLVAAVRTAIDGTPRVPDGPPLEPADAAAFLLKWADNVAEAYRAAYVSADGSQVDVWAVRFNDGTLAKPEGPSGAITPARGFRYRLVWGAAVVLVTAPYFNECARAVDGHIRSLK